MFLCGCEIQDGQSHRTKFDIVYYETAKTFESKRGLKFHRLVLCEMCFLLQIRNPRWLPSQDKVKLRTVLENE